MSVHVLVLLAFVGKPPAGHVCCHFPDRTTSNNRVTNLLWGTPKTNQAHAAIHGTKTQGEKCHKAVLTTEAVKEIRRKHATKQYTYAQLGEEYNVTLHTIFDIVRRRSWKHVE